MALLERLQILIDADGKGAVSEFHKVGDVAEKEAARAEKGIERTAKRMQSIGSIAALGGVAALGGFAALAKMSDEADKEQLKLQNSIKNSNKVFKDQGSALVELAGDLQQKTAADADAVVGAQALLVQFGLTESQVSQLSPLVVDLSRKMGIDLDQAAKAVGKSVDGSAGALKKMGIDVDATKVKTDGFGATMDALRGSVAGFAEQEGATFSGQLERLRNNLGDIGENVGKGAAGVLSSLAGSAASGAAALNELNPGILTAVGGLGTTAAITATVAGGFVFAAGKALEFANEVRAGNTALVKVGEDGTRSLTKVGKAAAGVAIVGSVVGIVETIAAVSNAIQNIDGQASKAMDKFRESLNGTGADAAKAFEDLARIEDETASVTGAFQSIGAEFKLGDLSVDVERFDDAFKSVLDNFGPEAAQKVVSGLRSQNNELDKNSDNYKRNAEILNESQGRIDSRRKALTEATRAERDQKRAVEEAIKVADQEEATYDGLVTSLKKYAERLKSLTVEYDAAAAGARGFSSAIERSTGIDDQLQSALSFNEALLGVNETLGALPKNVDALGVAFNTATDDSINAARVAVENFLKLGDQVRGFLSTFIQNGDVEGARRVAATIREQLTQKLTEQGFTPEQIQQYLGLAGVTDAQIDVAIKFAGAEAEMVKLQSQLQLFQQELTDAPVEVRVAINDALLAGDLDLARSLIETWVAATSGSPDAKVKIEALIAKYPQMAPVAAALQKEADANVVEQPVTANTGPATSKVWAWRVLQQGMAVEVPVKAKIDGSWRGVIGSLTGAASKSQAPQWTPTSQRPYPGANGMGGQDLNFLTPRAMGGPVNPNDTYLVGERGPEVFRPKVAGDIIPNHQLGAATQGAGPTTIREGHTFNIQSTDPVRTALEVVRRERDAEFLWG